MAYIFDIDVNIFKLIMKIRNPFKDNWGRWKDDISMKEKFIWNFLIIVGGMLLANILGDFIFN